MIPSSRTAVDGRQDEISQATADRMPVEPSLTRQEMADDTDVNTFLARYGVPIPQPAQYGIADYDLDMQGALIAVEESRAAFQALPQELQRKYGNWLNLLAAVEAGELSKQAVEQPQTPVEQPETPPKG